MPNETSFTPRPIRLGNKIYGLFPKTMHGRLSATDGVLYLVRPIEHGIAWLSTSPNPDGGFAACCPASRIRDELGRS